MAVGTLWSLPVVMAMRPAERHVRFQLLLAVALAGGAAALYGPALGADLRPEWPRGLDAFLSLEGAMPGALVLFGVLCLAGNALMGTFRRPAARAAILAACVLGVVPVLGTARIPAGDAGWEVAGRTVGGL